MDEQKKRELNAKYQRDYYARKKSGQAMPNPGRPANTPDVLWNKVDKRGEDECWEWKGYKNHDGYGRTWIKDRGYYAHRVIFNLANPNQISLEAPKSTDRSGFVLHHCDNPSCCNPKHLYLGNFKDNTRDKIERGRGVDFSGDKGPRCKLTMDQAREARKLRKQGKPVRELAILFGVSLPSMKSLLNGKSYKEAV
jgi:hypothetical protein